MSLRVCLVAVVCTLALTACGPGGDGSKSGIEIPAGVAADCGGAEPEIIEFTVTERAPVAGYPAIEFKVDTEDADKDLHWYQLRVWFDDEIDGVVSTDGYYYEQAQTNVDIVCNTPRVTLRMGVAIAGRLEQDEEYEFGAIVYDDMLNPSNGGEPVVQVFTTPTE